MDEARRKRAGIGAFCSGTLLAVCAFLPAMEHCGEDYVPIEAASSADGLPMLAPYLVGVLAAVAGAFVWRRARVPRVLAHVVVVWSVALMTALGIALAYGIASEPDEPFTWLFLVAWTLLVVPLTAAVRPRNLLPWRAIRALGVLAWGSAVWFTPLLLFTALEGSARVGLYVSLAATVGVIAAFFHLEANERRHPPSFPSARARETG